MDDVIGLNDGKANGDARLKMASRDLEDLNIKIELGRDFISIRSV